MYYGESLSEQNNPKYNWTIGAWANLIFNVCRLKRKTITWAPESTTKQRLKKVAEDQIEKTAIPETSGFRPGMLHHP